MCFPIYSLFEICPKDDRNILLAIFHFWWGFFLFSANMIKQEPVVGDEIEAYMSYCLCPSSISYHWEPISWCLIFIKGICWLVVQVLLNYYLLTNHLCLVLSVRQKTCQFSLLSLPSWLSDLIWTWLPKSKWIYKASLHLCQSFILPWYSPAKSVYFLSPFYRRENWALITSPSPHGQEVVGLRFGHKSVQSPNVSYIVSRPSS